MGLPIMAAAAGAAGAATRPDLRRDDLPVIVPLPGAGTLKKVMIEALIPFRQWWIQARMRCGTRAGRAPETRCPGLDSVEPGAIDFR